MGESRIIPTLHESGVHDWTWGQVIIQYVERAKDCLAKKIKKAASLKLQAASLTGPEGYCRIQTMNMKAIKDAAVIEQLRMNAAASIRIANAIEEILRLVKKDMETMKDAAK